MLIKVKRMLKKVSFILKRGCSNFVYAEAETTLSPYRQRRVVPLRSNLQIWVARKMELMYDYDQTLKLPFKNGVLLRANYIEYENRKRHRKLRNEGVKNVSFILFKSCSKFASGWEPMCGRPTIEYKPSITGISVWIRK